MPKDLIKKNKLYLYVPVGGDFWSESGFTSEDVIAALDKMSGDIVVHLNSPGGDVDHGMAIYQTLKDHDGKIQIRVDAAAFSAASIIAMAGDTIIMGRGARMMIHDPSTITWGDAGDHRRAANMLDSVSAVAAGIYSDRSGQSRDECHRLMADETWMTAEEAVENGFADALSGDDAPTMSFPKCDYSQFRQVPAAVLAARAINPIPAVANVVMAAGQQVAAATETKESIMPNIQPQAAPVQANEINAQLVAPAPVFMTSAEFDDLADRHDLTAKQIKKARALAMRKNNEGVEMGLDAVSARDAVLEIVSGRASNPVIQSHAPATVTEDAREKFVKGASLGMMARAGVAGGERNEFTGMPLLRMAEASLDHAGVAVPSGREAIARMAMSRSARMQHGTGDFVRILSNVAEKSMLKGFDETPEIYEEFTAAGTLGDFKPVERVDLSTYPTLPKVNEHGEYTYATLGDRKETIALSKYGSIFSISYEAIVNDDLGAFTRIPQAQGRAARRRIGDLVFAILTANPTMADGVALFDAAHNNLLTGATSVFGESALSKLRAQMALQKDGDAFLNIRPAHLLVPVQLEDAANVLMASEFSPGETQRVPNKVRGLATVHSDARLSAASTTAFYLAADPAAFDTIEVAYLDGRREPELFEEEGFDVDGVKMKIRQVVGVAPLGWRTLAKSNGS